MAKMLTVGGLRMESLIRATELLQQASEELQEVLETDPDYEPTDEELSPIEAVEKMNDAVAYYAEMLEELNRETGTGYDTITIIRKPTK